MKGSSKMQGPLSITDPIGSTHFQHDFCKYAPCFILSFSLNYYMTNSSPCANLHMRTLRLKKQPLTQRDNGAAF
ncbi:hypothetical protein CHCC19467_2406 [Bacillus paralicheniformis]|nr:hypothetical protein CHCC19467_2406 [Bacillus paralicheniformis]